MKPRFSRAALGMIFLGMIGLLLPASGQASLVTWEFTGTLAAVAHGNPARPGHDFGGILTKPQGSFLPSTVSGSITFDPHILDSNPNPLIGQYDGAITGLSYTVTNIFGTPYHFALDSNPGVSDHPNLWPAPFTPAPLGNSITILEDSVAATSLRITANVQNVTPLTGIAPPGGPDPGYFAQEFWIELVGRSGSVFATDALPGTPPAPSLFSLYDAVNNPDGQFRLGFRSGHDAPIFVGNLTSFVPVPAAVYLFGSGLVGLVGLARRKMSANA